MKDCLQLTDKECLLHINGSTYGLNNMTTLGRNSTDDLIVVTQIVWHFDFDIKENITSWHLINYWAGASFVEEYIRKLPNGIYDLSTINEEILLSIIEYLKEI